MFSQKKKNHTWIYLCGVLLILILAVFILVGAVSSRNSEEETLQANLETRAEEKSQTQDSSAASGQDFSEESRETETQEEEAEEKDDTEKDGQVQFYQSYYLVKYDKDGIRIYFSDETGRLTELEKTAIVYETLSEQDQIRFRDGIKVDTRDDLNRLIMDYES